MNEITDGCQELSFWQLIFLQSKVNGGPYYGDGLPRHYWDWPQETYLQRRLRYRKETHGRSRAQIEQYLFGEHLNSNN